MFKIEVDVNGETKYHYWMNKHADDFLQFLPGQFTREYGVEITSNDITVYKIDESKKDLLEGIMNNNHDAKFDMSEASKIKIKKVKEAKYKSGDVIPEADYNKEVLDTSENFKNATTKPDFINGKQPKKKKHDFGSGDVDAIEIEANDLLANDIVSEELNLTGVSLVQWPYDGNGKFLGNN